MVSPVMMNRIPMTMYTTEVHELIPLNNTKFSFTLMFAPSSFVELKGFKEMPHVNGLTNNEVFIDRLDIVDPQSEQHTSHLNKQLVQQIIEAKDGAMQMDLVRFIEVTLEAHFEANTELSFVVRNDILDVESGWTLGGLYQCRFNTEKGFSFTNRIIQYPDFDKTVVLLLWMNSHELEGSTWVEQPMEVLERVLDWVWRWK
eukprot:TRINITY_DN2338_c0_g1_i7.p1 TRINITY_DN2338_c0_g1~~TRINITY_DN2338_c0_g1_i7.p1  ORF type:complete len:201 (-),score=67.90 TRINITY_DN2338_c0_g1_i7:410-1012(-)